MAAVGEPSEQDQQKWQLKAAAASKGVLAHGNYHWQTL